VELFTVSTLKVNESALRFEKFRFKSRPTEVELSEVPVLKNRILFPSTPTEPDAEVEALNVAQATVTFVALGILPLLLVGTAFQLPVGELPDVRPVKFSVKFDEDMLK